MCEHPRGERVTTHRGAVICAACGTVTKESGLPTIGEVYEYQYLADGDIHVDTLRVVDVNETHVMYMLTCSRHVYPMTLEYWLKNDDKRRLVASKFEIGE